MPAVCDLLDKVRGLKETKATLKGIHYDKEDLPLLKKIEEKVAMPALVLISNGCALPVYHLIWNTPYIYPLAVLYKLVDLTIYSPAYQIGAVTCSIGLMIATAWATSKLFILEEENKIKDIEKLQKEAKNLKQYIEKILT